MLEDKSGMICIGTTLYWLNCDNCKRRFVGDDIVYSKPIEDGEYLDFCFPCYHKLDLSKEKNWKRCSSGGLIRQRLGRKQE